MTGTKDDYIKKIFWELFRNPRHIVKMARYRLIGKQGIQFQAVVRDAKGRQDDFEVLMPQNEQSLAAVKEMLDICNSESRYNGWVRKLGAHMYDGNLMDSVKDKKPPRGNGLLGYLGW